MLIFPQLQGEASAILKNKGLSAAIARELVTNAHTIARDGTYVQADGKKVRLQIASSSGAK